MEKWLFSVSEASIFLETGQMYDFPIDAPCEIWEKIPLVKVAYLQNLTAEYETLSDTQVQTFAGSRVRYIPLSSNNDFTNKEKFVLQRCAL